MHLQLHESAVSLEPGDVLLDDRDNALAESLSTLVGDDRAEQLLRRLGPNGLEHMTEEQIATSAGVPMHCAERIVAARTMACAVRERRTPRGSTPERLLAALPEGFGRLEHEVLVGFALTGANRIKAVVVLSVGGLSGAALMPRDAFVPMVRHGAHAFAIAHNHPSGDHTPSREDVLFTNALSRSAAVLCLPLVDHLVVARNGFTSFLEAGLMLPDDELKPQAYLRDAGGAP
jgi:DNA repair protein RadC